MTKVAVDHRFVPLRAKALTRGARCDLAAALLHDSSTELLARAEGAAQALPVRAPEELERLHGTASVWVRDALRLVGEGLGAVSLPAAGDAARSGEASIEEASEEAAAVDGVVVSHGSAGRRADAPE